MGREPTDGDASQAEMSAQAPDQPLGALFAAIAQGCFPPADGLTEAVQRPVGAIAAVLAFSGHCVVAADADPAWVAARCAPWDLGAAMSAGFLDALGARVGAPPGTLDVVLMAPSLPGASDPPLIQAAAPVEHPRAQRAYHVRTDVRTYHTSDGSGLLTVGRGLAGRWEAGFEVRPDARNRGVGRRLAAAARHLLVPDERLYMQVAPGNATSLRAVLAAGFVPIGAEVLFLAAH